MARTDTILSTGVSIDSAIVGMTAMVFVNDTAWVFFFLFWCWWWDEKTKKRKPKNRKTNFFFYQTIELGHHGEPIEDVILRIYRQTERDDENDDGDKKRGEKTILREGLSKGEGQRYYSTRRTFGDDCDEVCELFFFVLLFVS